jgi:thiol-disulfide isomerase/thioredoxin
MEKAGIAFIAAIVGLIVLVGGLSYVYFGTSQSGYVDNNGDDSSENGDPNEGLQLAPDFTLPKVGGGSVRLSDYRGKVVLLDFMATWCGPCINELEHLKEIDQRYGTDVVIISIDVDAEEGDSLLIPFATEHDVTWPVLRDTQGISQATGYSASSIPTLVVVNKDGYVRERYVGVTQASVLESVIDTILK